MPAGVGEEEAARAAVAIPRRALLLALVSLALAPLTAGERTLPAMDRLDRLAALFHRRWACPALAQLHRDQGAKFVTLVNALGASAGAMRQTIDELIDLGWVRRNPGYGHPLRPEYILTRRGERLAPACDRLDRAMRSIAVQDIALRKWSMPTLYVVGEGPTRFRRVVEALPGITDRAVSLALKDLASAEMITRRVLEGPPPGSAYGAAPPGARLLPILDAI